MSKTGLGLLASLAFLVLLAPVVDAAPQSAEGNASDASPVFKQTFLDPYLDFKSRVKEGTGFSWQVNYSVMGLQRVGETKDSHWTGQLDLIAGLELFGGKGQFLVYYMDVQLLSGLSNGDFSAANGNITGITDSDETSFLRQFWYRHGFRAGAVQVEAGITEPLLTFGGNRFAFDDRRKFMNVPMANVAAKDRTLSSPGVKVTWDAKDWLTLGASINDIGSEETEGRLKDATYYYLVHANFQPAFADLGESNYRLSYVVTEGNSMFERSDGLIVSFDQDLGERWGAFLRYDDTEFQTRSSLLNQSASFGLSHRRPFGRAGDTFGVGALRTRSDQGGSFKEWGGETFYQLNLTDWMHVSLHAQYIDPAKEGSGIFNLGGRVFFAF